MRFPPWLRSWAGMILIGSAVVGLAGTLALASEVGRPFGGYISYSVALDDVGHISEETPLWWPIYRLGEDITGTTATVNGLPYTPNVSRIFAEAQPGESVTVGFIRDGAEVELSVPVVRFDWADFLDLKLPEIIVAVSFWLLGIVVLRAGPDQPTNQVFAALAGLITAHRLLNTHFLIIDNRLLPNLLEAALLVVSSFMGATAFNFAWVYPTPLPRRPRILIGLLYALGVILAAALALGRVTRWPAGIDPPNVALTSAAYRIMLYVYLLGLAAIIGRLIYSALRESSTRRERRILLLTGIGMALALPFLVLSAGDVLPGIEPNLYWRNLDLRFLFVAIPLMIALAIIRYQNMVVPSRVFVFVAVLGSSALLANIGAWFWQLAQPDLISESERLPFFAFFVAIFASSLFWSMQAVWGGWFSRLLQREPKNYASTRDLGRRLQEERDLADLPGSLVEGIAEELHLEAAAVWLADYEGTVFLLAAQSGDRQLQLPEALPFPRARPDGYAIRLTRDQPIPAWLAPLAAAGGIEIALPLYKEDQPVALLGFGRRWDEEIFDNRDLIIIELIGQQAQLYLQVQRQIEELRQVPQKVSAAQERERTLLAAELHDTIQQFLGRLPFFLVASRDAMADDPEEAAELLERCLVDIAEAALTVQRIRQNLAPSQLERSLSRSLSALTLHIQQRYEIEVPLQISGDLDKATNLETRLALYRVIQHALDNAVRHAGADKVQVTLQQEDGQIAFSVRDNGRGATEHQLWLAQAEGHYGLQSMRTRIESCGGQFVFETAAGAGTAVSGWTPAVANDSEQEL